MSVSHDFVVENVEGTLTLGFYDDGAIGELFIEVAKQGSTLSGFIHSWAIAISMGLQYGIPLESFATKFKDMSFPPNGLTNYKEIYQAKSLVDYVFRWIENEYPGGRLSNHLPSSIEKAVRGIL
jgi:ribonucleoside-diphosphate reductase alpha chain